MPLKCKICRTCKIHFVNSAISHYIIILCIITIVLPYLFVSFACWRTSTNYTFCCSAFQHKVREISPMWCHDKHRFNTAGQALVLPQDHFSARQHRRVKQRVRFSRRAKLRAKNAFFPSIQAYWMSNKPLQSAIWKVNLLLRDIVCFVMSSINSCVIFSLYFGLRAATAEGGRRQSCAYSTGRLPREPSVIIESADWL